MDLVVVALDERHFKFVSHCFFHVCLALLVFFGCFEAVAFLVEGWVILITMLGFLDHVRGCMNYLLLDHLEECKVVLLLAQ